MLFSSHFIEQGVNATLVVAFVQLIIAMMLIIAFMVSNIALDEKYKTQTLLLTVVWGYISGNSTTFVLENAKSTLLKCGAMLLLTAIVTLIIPGHKIKKENKKEESL